MIDDLGNRMKDQYESRTRFLVPRRTYTLLRVDGKAFHTYTRKCIRPFDFGLMEDMDKTAMALCEEIQGAVFAYIQSDEISVLVTDFNETKTCAWFDGNVQKMASISASIATAAFNKARHERYLDDPTEPPASKWALFDSRVWTIPDPIEVENYFIWRQQDASKNSVQMVARSLYSHKELTGKGISELHDMIHAKGKNWNDFSVGAKRGRVIARSALDAEGNPLPRPKWTRIDPPIFTQERSFLRSMVPIHKPLAFPLHYEESSVN